MDGKHRIVVNICAIRSQPEESRVQGRFYGLDKREWSLFEGKEPGLHAACLVSCLGKDTGVLFRLNYSIHQHTGIGCYTSS